eukprot:5753878-Lingulodinium_polyedra.AAC.1
MAMAFSTPLAPRETFMSPMITAGTSPRLRSHAIASIAMRRFASATRAPSACPHTCTTWNTLLPPRRTA